MKQWLELRKRYLHILLEMEGRKTIDKCSVCRRPSDIKCPDCFGSCSFCKDCCLEAHRRSPFHRPLQWNSTHYTQVSLHSLGLSICLGHDGAPCPQTVSNPGRKGRSVHGRARSTSLDSVQEGLESPESFGQLPTPRGTPQPEDQSSRRDIPDMLFDVPEIPLESTDAAASRKRTTDSRNPLFTVVDRGGIFDMEVVFCICSELDNTDEQLLQAGLFPATFKQIETLFTFSVLEDFLVDNLECKTTAQQFYAKLQNMTSKMFPNNVPNRYKQLLRASRQWRDLKNRMEHGLGHLPEWETIPDGSMAIFCPACPQPGVNLPVDWKTRYRDSPYLIRTFIMDGNFSAEHMKHRPGEKDIALSAGMAFMANPDSYKAHLKSGQEIVQVCGVVLPRPGQPLVSSHSHGCCRVVTQQVT
ncbi:hypothetical protein EDB85DRAFT_1873573 [Lactarius pseudohatsudake]|nr:hypothetical protein EDB85DRAFT_1873573 [Lactarius pseudohatsudake]